MGLCTCTQSRGSTKPICTADDLVGMEIRAPVQKMTVSLTNHGGFGFTLMANLRARKLPVDIQAIINKHSGAATLAPQG